MVVARASFWLNFQNCLKKEAKLVSRLEMTSTVVRTACCCSSIAKTRSMGRDDRCSFFLFCFELRVVAT